MTLKSNLILLCLLALFTIGAHAQQQGGPSPMDTPPSAEQLKAAEEVLNSLHMDQQLTSSYDAMTKQGSASLPEGQRAAFIVAMRKFLVKYCSWEAMKPELCAIYAKNFTVSELKQLAVFYATPLGQKVSAKTPELMQQSMQLGQQIVIKHQQELVQMMTEAQKQ